MFDARAFLEGSLFSDAHKDAYGRRPSQDQWARWSVMTEAELIAERDRLYDAVEDSIEEDARRHADAAVRFEARVADVIATGAQDRATALRWIADAEDAIDDIKGYGNSYLEYHLGLKYGYLGQTPIV